MNSFTLTAVGHLARSPEVVTKGDVTCTRFCLIGNDYGGKDDEGVAREVITSVWFVAFGAAGEIIARHSHKGDQLIVEARVRSNIWTDKQGEKQYDHSFVVQGFKFGAPGKVKREELEGRREQTLSLPPAEDHENGREREAPDEHGGVGREGAYVDATPDAVAEVADSPRGTVDAQGGTGARSSSGANGSEVPPGSPGESYAVRTTSAPASPKVTPEKSRGARSSRKSTATVA